MEKNRNTILVFYGVLSLVVILCSVPDLRGQNMGMSLVTIELIVAYIARMRWPRGESFEENHTTFIIRSIWMYTFLYTLGAFATTYIVWSQGNHDALDAMADVLGTGAVPSESDFQTLTRQYAEDNAQLMLDTFRLWICPAQLYLVWRILRGGGRAFKGYRTARPKSWI